MLNNQGEIVSEAVGISILRLLKMRSNLVTST